MNNNANFNQPLRGYHANQQQANCDRMQYDPQKNQKNNKHKQKNKQQHQDYNHNYDKKIDDIYEPKVDDNPYYSQQQNPYYQQKNYHQPQQQYQSPPQQYPQQFQQELYSDNSRVYQPQNQDQYRPKFVQDNNQMQNPQQNNNQKMNDNNLDGFQPLNFQIKQNNNQQKINSVTLQITKQQQQQNNQYYYDQLHNFINIIFNQSDIEINLTNISPQFEQQYVSQLKNEFQGFIINIQHQSEQELLDEQQIFQCKGQQDNNILPQDQMIYIQNGLFNEFLTEAEKKQIQILINFNKYQYKIASQIASKNYKEVINYFSFFKKTIQENVILIYESKTNFETKLKTKILQKQRNQEELKKQLKCQKIIINDIFSLQYDLFFNQQLIDYAMKLQEQNAYIICLAQFNTQQNIKNLQDIFVKFVQNKDNIKQINEKFDFQVSFIPNLDDIDQKIDRLQETEQIEIIISNPQSNLQSNKYVIYVELNMILEGYLLNNIIETQIKKIKETIISFYIPNITIQVEKQDKIEIWQEFLCQKYESRNNIKDCQTKTINQNQIIIELNGDYESILQKGEQISKDLEQYILLNYTSTTIDISILKGIQDKSYQKMFKKELIDLWSNNFGDGFIRIKNIDASQKQFVIMIIYNQNKAREKDIIKVINEKFLEELTLIEQQLEYEGFLTFIGLNDFQFQDQKQIIVNKVKKSKYQFIGSQKKIEEIKKIIEQFNEQKKEQKITETIEIDCQLIVKKLELFYNQNKVLKLPENTGISFLENKIIITQDKKFIQQAKDSICSIVSDFKQQLIQSPIQFSDQEINYIYKKLQPKIAELTKNHECQIEFKSNSMSTKPQRAIASSLTYQNKIINIVYGDISQLECEAIVNSCNNKMSFGDPSKLSGVAQKIFDIAGNSYHAFCKEYINRHQELKVGIAITYEMPIGRYIRYVINVATPIYSKGTQTSQDFEEIKKNISAIFQEANQKGITILAIPILGAGACGYSFEETANLVINEVINQHFSNINNIQIIHIVEIYQQRVETIKNILQQLTSQPIQQRLIKYQWQWQENNLFKDYDDEDINKQIDEGYEQFLKTKQETKIQLKFAYSKQPGTHQVDLNQMIITDISLKTSQQIKEQIVNNSQRFFINGQQIDDQLNEYFVLQKMNKQKNFQIFYKRHSVIFNQQQMYQINEETQFKRNIQGIKYNKSQQNENSKKNIIQGKQFKIQNYQYEKFIFQKQSTQQLIIESFDGSINKQIFESLKAEIKKETIAFKLDVPNLSTDDLVNFEQFLTSISLSITGQVLPGKQVEIQILQSKQSKVKQRLMQINATIKQYPKNWAQQNENCVRVQIQQNSQEYQNIQNIFQQTEQGTIYAIYRIQNKALWDNYIHDKNKLIEYYKSQGQTLNKLEEERYLWHGVRGQHPKIIYSGLREAFDPSFSNAGMWGQGIYFAQRASYSRNYSYTLQATDDKLLAGKLVFLCCLVTTGRVEQRQPDNSIRRPSAGYDCVTGFTNGSDVFMLYSMDIRRAYPAYEIVYS